MYIVHIIDRSTLFNQRYCLDSYHHNQFYSGFLGHSSAAHGLYYALSCNHVNEKSS